MRAYSRQNKPTASYESAMIQEALLNQSKQIAYQQEQLNSLGKGFRDIAEILQEQHQSNPKKAIEENNQSITAMTNAILSLHKQLKEANFGQEFADIKSQQQSIGKAVVTNRKSLESQANDLAYYFGWKHIAMIVVSTAVISSLCSVAVTALFPLAISQITGVNQPKSIEKVKPVVKKNKGG
jgi:glutathionylspermidine synthase